MENMKFELDVDFDTVEEAKELAVQISSIFGVKARVADYTPNGNFCLIVELAENSECKVMTTSFKVWLAEREGLGSSAESAINSVISVDHLVL